MQLNIAESETFQSVKNITIPDVYYRKMKCGIPEIDLLFNEGFLPGSTFTLTAQAGCGKTTLMLQILEQLSKKYKVGYASGEEHIHQLAFTAKRIKCENVPIANITDVDKLVEMTKTLNFLVVDSFQSLTTKYKHFNNTEKDRYAVQELTKAAKANECTICFIVHLTKMGVIKGSTLLPHTVDANMNIEMMEEYEEDGGRTIFFIKNRFGPLNTLNAFITNNGYDFNRKFETEIVDVKQTKNKNKFYESILTMEGDITVSNLVEKLDINIVKAGSLLRELTQLNRLVKVGRGSEAVWNVVKKTVNMDV